MCPGERRNVPPCRGHRTRYSEKNTPQLLLNVLFLSWLQSRAFLRLNHRQSKVFFLSSQGVPSFLGTVLASCLLPCETRAALVRFAPSRLSRPPGHIPGCLLLPGGLCSCLSEAPSKFLCSLRPCPGLFLRSRSSCAKWSRQTASCEDVVHLLQARHEYPSELKIFQGVLLRSLRYHSAGRSRFRVATRMSALQFLKPRQWQGGVIKFQRAVRRC